jgi:TRAP-type C4-dicarboxylate transport system permease large subunit
MSISGVLQRVALVRTEVSEERIASIIRVKGIRELITAPVANRSVLQLLVTDVVPSWLIVSTLMLEAIYSSETSVLTRTTLRHNQQDAILQSHCRKTLKSFIALTGRVLYRRYMCLL